jgi:tetratricopeptide (TPR) repeat protein
MSLLPRKIYAFCLGATLPGPGPSTAIVKLLCVLAACWVVWPTPSQAQDEVTIRTTASGGSTQRRTGEVIEYTGQGVQLRESGGRVRSFSPAQVVRVVPAKSPEHLRADESFDRGRFEEAAGQYRIALRSERRTWVARMILARQAWCYRALGRAQEACETFLLLVRSDPTTPFFDCIPLAWIPSQPSPTLEREAVGWLTRNDLPAAGLLGASYLLSGSQRPRALARLNQLTASQDGRIAWLAQTQLWRSAYTAADVNQLDTWSRAVEEMPEPLRAGPYYVLGTAYGLRRKHEQAALALLRIPILYPRHRRLAARCLYEAGRALEELGRRQEAARLYAELVAEYPQSRDDVGAAQSRLDAMRAKQ